MAHGRTRRQAAANFNMSADEFVKRLAEVRKHSRLFMPADLREAGRAIAMKLYPILSYRQISDILGVDKGTINNWLTN